MVPIGKTSGERQKSTSLGGPLALSLALHILGLYFLAIVATPRADAPEPITVALYVPKPAEEKKSEQIVSPSQAPEVEENPEANKLSDTTTMTAVEQLRRGEVEPTPTPPPEPAKTPPREPARAKMKPQAPEVEKKKSAAYLNSTNES